MTETELCPCGQPLHYSSPDSERQVADLVAKLGDTVVVKALQGHQGFKVPRHYIALHGIKAAELEDLANRYGWERTSI